MGPHCAEDHGQGSVPHQRHRALWFFPLPRMCLYFFLTLFLQSPVCIQPCITDGSFFLSICFFQNLGSIPASCCFVMTSKKIPKQLLKSYKKITNSRCTLKATVWVDTLSPTPTSNLWTQTHFQGCVLIKESDSLAPITQSVSFHSTMYGVPPSSPPQICFLAMSDPSGPREKDKFTGPSRTETKTRIPPFLCPFLPQRPLHPLANDSGGFEEERGEISECPPDCFFALFYSFKTKSGKDICADPKQKWVQDATKYLDQILRIPKP